MKREALAYLLRLLTLQPQFQMSRRGWVNGQLVILIEPLCFFFTFLCNGVSCIFLIIFKNKLIKDYLILNDVYINIFYRL